MIKLFSFTIFLASTLIFCIQPLVGKMLLPKFGSSAGVWNSCVLFFQFSLFLGYLYAIFINKIKLLSRQIILHLILFVIVLIYSLFTLSYGFDYLHHLGIINSYNYYPEVQILLYLLVLLSPSLIILSATSPLIQSWYSKTNFQYANNPYPLYSISNIANIFGLILFILIMEPMFGNQQQYSAWHYSFFGLFGLFLICGLAVYRHQIIGCSSNLNTRESTVIPATEQGSSRLDPCSARGDNIEKSGGNNFNGFISYIIHNYKKIIYWLALSAIPSSLLLSTSQLITTNIVAMPLFWVIPLVLYLLSFVIAFARKKYFKITKLNYVVALILPILIFCKITSNNPSSILFNLFIFFTICILSHYYLYVTKPNTKYLTLYYLIISIGGIIGSSFNTFIAPHLFHDYYEYPLVLSLSILLFNYKKFKLNDYAYYICFLVFIISVLAINNLFYKTYYYLDLKNIVVMFFMTAIVSSLFFLQKRILFSFCTLLLAILPVLKDNFYNVIYINRNFYGKQTVIKEGSVNRLMSGSIVHGMQAKNSTTYTYYRPVADIIKLMPENLKISVVGLGAGTISCLKKADDNISFIEINPDMISVASNRSIFSYTSDCGPVAVQLGDGRLKLEQATDNSYDIIVFDAFNGGNIPSHLMTKEAIEIYTKKLKSRGLLLFHISNRYINLSAVLSGIAYEAGLNTYRLRSVPSDAYEFVSDWVALIPNSGSKTFDYKILKQANFNWQETVNKQNVVWTDDYTNILAVIK